MILRFLLRIIAKALARDANARSMTKEEFEENLRRST
jgi:hypothetical protein